MRSKMQVVFVLLLSVTLEAKRSFRTHPNSLTKNGIRNANESRYRNYPFLIPVILNEIDPGNELNKAADKTRIFKRSNGIYAKFANKSIDKPLGFLSPRDKLLYEEKYRQNKYLEDPPQLSYGGQTFSKMNYDFESLLERNLANSGLSGTPMNSRSTDNTSDKIQTRTQPAQRKPNPKIRKQFEDNSFFLKSSKVSQESTKTTCDEFAHKALFHPNDVVNIVWIPFYKWSSMGPSVSVLHKFVYPTKKKVQQYKDKYGKFYRNINWKEPKLLLFTLHVDMLLIAGDRKGLFYGIPDTELSTTITSTNFTLASVKIRMKIVDPYLAMMYCDEDYAIIMAILGEDPSTDEDKEKEAACLNFKGTGEILSRDIELEEEIKEAAKQKKIKEEESKAMPPPPINTNPALLITRF